MLLFVPNPQKLKINNNLNLAIGQAAKTRYVIMKIKIFLLEEGA